MSKILSLTGAQAEALKNLLQLTHQLDDQQALILSEVLTKLNKPDKVKSKMKFATPQELLDELTDNPHGWDPA